MRLLVAILLEVKIVGNGDLAALVGVIKINVHLEFAPSFILAGEWRVGKGFGAVSERFIQTANGQGRLLTLNRVGERGVEVEDDLCKTICLVVFTLLVYDEDLNVPFPEGKALRGRRLVLTIAICQSWESRVC